MSLTEYEYFRFVISTAVFLQRNENPVMVNNAAINSTSTEVKTTRNSN